MKSSTYRDGYDLPVFDSRLLYLFWNYQVVIAINFQPSMSLHVYFLQILPHPHYLRLVTSIWAFTNTIFYSPPPIGVHFLEDPNLKAISYDNSIA